MGACYYSAIHVQINGTILSFPLRAPREISKEYSQEASCLSAAFVLRMIDN